MCLIFLNYRVVNTAWNASALRWFALTDLSADVLRRKRMTDSLNHGLRPGWPPNASTKAWWADHGCTGSFEAIKRFARQLASPHFFVYPLAHFFEWFHLSNFFSIIDSLLYILFFDHFSRVSWLINYIIWKYFRKRITLSSLKTASETNNKFICRANLQV